MAEAAETMEKAAPVPSVMPMKMVMIIAAGALLIGLGGAVGVMKFMGGGHKEEEKVEATAAAAAPAPSHGEAQPKQAEHGGAPGQIFDVDPFIVNLADGPDIKYLKLTVKLELDRADAVEELKARTPALRDSILILLSSKESTTLRTAQGKLQLRDEIVQRVNGLLPRPWVKTAYFLEFVLQ